MKKFIAFCETSSCTWSLWFSFFVFIFFPIVRFDITDIRFDFRHFLKKAFFSSSTQKQTHISKKVIHILHFWKLLWVLSKSFCDLFKNFCLPLFLTVFFFVLLETPQTFRSSPRLLLEALHCASSIASLSLSLFSLRVHSTV